MEHKYRTIYDGGHFIDGIGFSSMEDAVSTAWEILHNWMDACLSDDPKGWNEMISECSVWVEEYDEESGEWEEIWWPDDDTLKEIGWVDHGEED